MSWFAAVDIGASSGRVILGQLLDGHLETEEVHRFANVAVHLPTRTGTQLCWDAVGLFAEVRQGLSEAVRRAGALEAIGIDTWGVDYGLLDADGVLAAPVVSYRDHRTHGVSERVFETIDPHELYGLTGTQVQDFNTVFQLVASRHDQAPQRASALLLMPDLLGYWLTGQLRTEVTNASTTGLVDPATRQWSQQLLDKLEDGPDFRGLLSPLAEPGTILGPVLPQVAPNVTNAAGDPTPVVLVGSHDTASAVVGVPAQSRDFAYISSGTWSLVGLELAEPVLSEASRTDNFTNELGIDATVRYLKNVSGMWVFNQCLAEWGLANADIPELLTWAAEEPALDRIIDLNDASLVDPGPMTDRINALLTGSGQLPVTTAAQGARTVVDSLALAYRQAIASAVRHSGRPVDVVHIVGGGCRNALLCQATADATGLPVVAGPVEGTAIGNLLVAARGVGAINGGLADLRRVISSSITTVRYEPVVDPQTTLDWERAAAQLNSFTELEQGSN